MKSKKRKAIFAGSFDPITNGHLDIICRASKLFDELQIGVLYNPNKKGLFSFDERVELIKACTNHLKNIKVVSFDGLLVNYCKDHGIGTLIRGVRTGADIEYELQMAHMNRELNSNIETIMLPTKTEYSFISSSLIKEVLTVGGDVKNLVPKNVLDELERKTNGGNEKCM
jgi:pantetheine-phosphate adenylyltransferase|nr:pantetheine-phosphate adenylyltransferase [uncultured Romboutsia sp.]